MTKAIRLSAQIPFPGFYGSWYEDGLDSEGSQWAEYTAEEDNGREGDEMRYPPELRLNAGDLSEMLFYVSDYSAMRLSIARQYVDAFAYHYKDYFGYDLAPEFEEVVSPREYNFQTDRIFALVPLKTFRAMMRDHKADGYKTLHDVIEERHTSRSGFISFYKTALKEWLSKPLTEWDHNELHTLIKASAVLKGTYGTSYDATAEGVEGDRFCSEVYDSVAEGEGFYGAWEQGIDWDALEAKRTEARQGKLDALEESDLIRWRELSGDGDAGNVSFRCTETIELFEARPF